MENPVESTLANDNHREFLLTRKSFHFYRPSETFSVQWWGLRWKWLPSRGSGIGPGGWSFQWLCVDIHRTCFEDGDEWGEETQEDIGMIFLSLLDGEATQQAATHRSIESTPDHTR
jgi:hypothetical protein